MKPLFTVHAGEYLLACHVERQWHKLNVWIPSRDTGVDLLVSDHDNCHTVSLQAKFSRDYLPTHMKQEFQKPLRACGFCTINRKKLAKSQADLWVFVLHGFKRHSTDFVIVPPEELEERLKAIHGSQTTTMIYLWVTEEEKCWEPRGLPIKDKRRIARGEYENPGRDFTQWLNKWDSVTGPLGAKPQAARAAGGSL